MGRADAASDVWEMQGVYDNLCRVFLVISKLENIKSAETFLVILKAG